LNPIFEPVLTCFCDWPAHFKPLDQKNSMYLAIELWRGLWKCFGRFW